MLSTYTNLQTYKNLAYLMTTFPLGLAYFIFLVVGLSLGFGLLVILVGLPILLFVAAVSAVLVELEQRLAAVLLNAQFDPPVRVFPHDRQLLARLVNSDTLKGVIYLGLKFPLGLMTFVGTMIAVSLTFGLLFAPFTYPSFDVEIMGWTANTLPEALIASVMGIGIGLITLPILNRVAELWRDFTESMLSSDQPRTVKIKNAYDDYFETGDVKRKNTLETDDEPFHAARPIQSATTDTPDSLRQRIAQILEEDEKAD